MELFQYPGLIRFLRFPNWSTDWKSVQSYLKFITFVYYNFHWNETQASLSAGHSFPSNMKAKSRQSPRLASGKLTARTTDLSLVPKMQN